MRLTQVIDEGFQPRVVLLVVLAVFGDWGTQSTVRYGGQRQSANRTVGHGILEVVYRLARRGRCIPVDAERALISNALIAHTLLSEGVILVVGHLQIGERTVGSWLPTFNGKPLVELNHSGVDDVSLRVGHQLGQSRLGNVAGHTLHGYVGTLGLVFVLVLAIALILVLLKYDAVRSVLCLLRSLQMFQHVLGA